MHCRTTASGACLIADRSDSPKTSPSKQIGIDQIDQQKFAKAAPVLQPLLFSFGKRLSAGAAAQIDLGVSHTRSG
eukprot:scaffold28893_cov40-Phaeocystis_antarctica.AAC.2